MKTTTINIELGANGAIGTRATVTQPRWFRKPISAVYLCHRPAALLSAEWINQSTGMAADDGLSHRLNEAAQAAARLAGKA